MAAFTALWIVTEAGQTANLFSLKLGLIISAYVCVCLVLSSEAKDKAPNLVVQLLAVLLIATLSWFASDLYFEPIMALGSVLLFLGNAAFWRRASDNDRVWHFTHLIWTAALFATLGSVIFFLGINAITIALSSLFGLDIDELTHRLLIPIGLCFLAPMYWMSTVPKTADSESWLGTESDFNARAIGFIGVWLLAPLVLIYAIILIAYVLKLLLAWELPDNEVARLVIPFLLLGTLTWLVLYAPLLRAAGRVTLWYRRCWFVIMLPVSLLLAVVVVVRVAEYGLTPPRILLICCVVWALSLGVYFTVVTPAKQDIRFIPGFASLLLLVASLISGSVSYSSQLNRATRYLHEAGLQSENGDQLWQRENYNSDEIQNTDAAIKARGALSYVLQRNGDRAIDALFPGVEFNVPELADDIGADIGTDIGTDIGDDSQVDYDLTVVDEHLQTERMEWAILEALGLTDVQFSTPMDVADLSYFPNNEIVDISRFDSMQRIDFFPDESQQPLSSSLSIRQSGEIVTLYENNKKIAHINLRQWAENQKIENGQLTVESPVIDFFDEPERQISLFIRELQLPGSDESEYVFIQADLLLRGM
ncbi:MAG: DUF4153 domain-containing protein [Granulosicoccus sp.]|nr:DUF4153 domain-containing protein [Granulosicoccus sp.]